MIRRGAPLAFRLVRWILVAAAATGALVLAWFTPRAGEILEALADGRSTPAESLARLQLLGLVAFALGLSVLGLAATWWSVSFSRRLAVLRQGADRLAAGDLEAQIPLERHPPELALLADSILRLARDQRRQLQAAEAQRHELTSLLSGLRDGVLSLDRGGRVQACNPAAARLLELGGHPVGARLADLGAPAELSQWLEGRWQEAETELRLVAGVPRELRVRCLPLADGVDRRGERLLVVLSDVSTANEVERLRRAFVANVSHELKTPVTSIRGYAEMLAEEVDASSTPGRFLPVIVRQARRLDAIIEDLLDLSRLERQQEGGAQTLAPLDLRPLLEELLEDHAPLARAAGVELELRLDPSAPRRADSHWPLLQRALGNLLGNAIRYGKPGTPVQVAVLPGSGPDELCIEVRDQGCGIPPEHLPRLFERFYVVDKARSRELGGTGLGLAIVKHAAALLGGSVEVESEVGTGSVFRLRLPAARA